MELILQKITNDNNNTNNNKVIKKEGKFKRKKRTKTYLSFFLLIFNVNFIVRIFLSFTFDI